MSEPFQATPIATAASVSVGGLSPIGLEQARVPASRAQLGCPLHPLNKDMRQRIEELAYIAAAMPMQAQLQARPDEDGAQNAN